MKLKRRLLNILIAFFLLANLFVGMSFIVDSYTNWKTTYNGSDLGILCLCSYNDKLYAGTNSNSEDCDILVFNGNSWSVSWDGENDTVFSMATYNNKLYAGVGNSDGEGDIYVYDGSSWSVSYNGSASEIRDLCVYNGSLYAAQVNLSSSGYGDVLVFDGSTWSISYDGAEEGIFSLAVYNGNLYAGQGYDAGDGDILIYDGASWDTCYDNEYEACTSLSSYNGNLYAGIYDNAENNDILAYDGASWSVSREGSGIVPREIAGINSLYVYDNKLYAAISDGGNGSIIVYNDESWSTTYSSVYDGFHSLCSFYGKLYAGSGNDVGFADIYCLDAYDKNNIRTDGTDNTYLYMTMEDGKLPYFSYANQMNYKLDANSTIQGKYCVNGTSKGVAGAYNFYYMYPTPIQPKTWSIKFKINSTTDSETTFILIRKIGFSYVTELELTFITANGSIRLIDGNWGTGTNHFHWFTGLTPYKYNCIYTLTLSDFHYAINDYSFDATFSNATASQTITNVHFEYNPGLVGLAQPIYGFGFAGSNFFGKTTLFIDDWTVGTQSLIESDAASNIKATTTNFNGELINDGSPLQNASQSNHTIKVLYDTQSHPTNYTYYFNEASAIEQWSGNPYYMNDSNEDTYANYSTNLIERFENSQSTGGGWGFIRGNIYYGQTFDIGYNGKDTSIYITKISRYIKKYGNPNNLHVVIKNITTSDKPGNIQYCDIEIPASSISSSFVWQDLIFPEPILLDNEIENGKYCFYLYQVGGDVDNSYSAQGKTPGTYNGGGELYTGDGGTTWSYTSSQDEAFEIYGYIANHSQMLTSHTGNTTSIPTENISKVEIRAKSYLSSDAYDGKISLQPVFNNVNGTSYNIFSNTTASWSDWIDITHDNCVSNWNWTNVKKLNCRAIANLIQGTAYVGKVELRISINATMDYAYNETVAGSYHGNTTDTDTFSKAVSGLIPGTIYYYRTYINTSYTNSSSYCYGDEEYFLTKPTELPKNFHSQFINTDPDIIEITWTKGTNTNGTILVRNTDHYPNNISDGTIVYNGTGTSWDDYALSKNYFRAWSYLKYIIDGETLFQISGTNVSLIFVTTENASPEEISHTIYGYLITNRTCTVRFNHGDVPAYGMNTTNSTISSTQSFSKTVIGNAGELHYYRAYANDSNGNTSYGQDKYFLAKPYPPTNLKTCNMTSMATINLSWNNALADTGANRNVILRKTGGYPASITDGTIIYNESALVPAGSTTYFTTTVIPGTTYYYKAWSFSKGIVGTDTLIQWSDDNSSCYSFGILTLNATNVEETTARLNSYLLGNPISNYLRFSYGYTTSYGTNTSNQTVSGMSYVSSNISSLTPGRLYHFRGYANASSPTVSSKGIDRYFLTKPEAVTNTNYNIINSTTINLSWTKGTGANNTVILRKTTGAPSSYTDGTIVYNGTGTYSKQSIVMGTTYYYRMWSYSKWIVNPTLQQWSDAGVNVSNIGGLAIDVFDEVTCENLTTYSVFITNKNGSQVYSNTSCHNTHIINLSLCPHGDDIQIIINSSGYHQRLYTMDIYTGMLGYLKAYLPPVSSPPDGGGDDGDTTEDCVQRAYTDSKTVTNHTIDATISLTHTLDSMISVELYNDSLYGTYGGWIFVTADNYTYTTTQVIIEHEILDANTTMVRASYYYLYCPGDSLSALYDIQVVESIETSYTKIDQPVEDVFVEVKRYENNTGVYTTVSSLFTDANGHVNIYLMPNVLYKVFISKDGYEDKISDYIPSPPNNYGQTEIKILRIVKIIEYDENPHVPYLMENITWHIYPDSHLFQTPFTIIFHINSSDAQLQWYYMRVWYLDPSNNTWYVLYFSNQTNAYGGDISYTVPNATGRYSAECCFKKTGYDEYCLGMEGSFSWVLQHLKEWMQSVPDVAYFLVLTIICAVVMGFFMMYLGTGIMTGYIGIGIYVLGLLLKPVTLTLDSHGSTISGWAIVTIVAIVYTIGIYLWSRL